MARSARETIIGYRRVLRIYWSPLFAAAGTIWAVLAALSIIGDELASPKLQKFLRVGNHIPHLSPVGWIAVGLGIVTLAGFHGTWKELRRLDGKHHAELQAERRSHQQQIESEQAALTAERTAHEKTRIELDRVLARPVSHEHRDRLITIARSVISTVSGSIACKYYDGRIYGHDAKAMFVSHFPESGELLDDWDATTVVRDEAVTQLDKRVHGEAAQLDEKFWSHEAIFDGFNQYMVIYSRRAGVGVPMPAPFIGERDGFIYWDSPAELHAGFLGFKLSTDGYTPGRLRQLKAEFEKFFESVVTSSEMGQLDDAYSQLVKKRAEVISAMNAVISRDEIYGHCQICDHP